MFDLKKTALAVLVLGSSVGFAGTMGPVCVPGSVTVPCPSTAWDFGVQALYLKPSYNANSVFVGYVFNNGRQIRNEFKPDWAWGFKLEGSYHFNTGNDFNVNWYHYNKKTTHSFIVFSEDFLIHLPFTTSIKPEWDAVNFELGQHVDFGESKDIRFHGGFQYLHLTHEIVDINRLTGTPYYSHFKFNGFGPRVGTDLSYNVNTSFAVYANGAAALLTGDNKLSGDPAITGFQVSSSKWSVVPELEIKTGAKYNYSLVNSVITFDAGYMWINYFNAQFATSLLPEESNVAFTGPYAGIKWVGNL